MVFLFISTTTVPIDVAITLATNVAWIDKNKELLFLCMLFSATLNKMGIIITLYERGRQKWINPRIYHLSLTLEQNKLLISVVFLCKFILFYFLVFDQCLSSIVSSFLFQ